MVLGRSLPVIFALALSASTLPFYVTRAQDSQSQQSPSVAEAARRSRAKRKADKSPKVITDENFPATHQPGQDVVNVGAPAEPASLEDAEKAAAEQTLQKEAGEAATQEDAEIAKLKKQVAEAEKELDLQKREFVLDNDAYYSKPGFSDDKAGKAKLDSEQQQIASQQQEVDRLKARLAPLLERRSRRNPKASQAPTGESEKPSRPAPPQP